MRVFQPECTLPEEGPAFIQQPNVRSTMDIIWSSLTIIFLCTWSITHLNVPPQVRPLPPAKSFWEECRRAFFEAWYSLRRKAVWMLVNILVPEFLLGKALAEFVAARHCTNAILEFQREEKHDDEISWTPTHSHYANMGGVFVKFESDHTESSIIEASDTTSQWIKKLIDRCEAGYPGLGPFDWAVHKKHHEFARTWLSSHLNDSDGRFGARMLSGDVWALSASQLLLLRKMGVITRFPDISERQINDKNKADAVVKFIAIVQVLWLAIQLAVRAAAGRQSSQIEITALAFAVCALITYLLLIHRPKDVSVPVVISAYRDVTFEEFTEVIALTQPVYLAGKSFYSIPTSTTPCTGTDSGRYSDLQTLGILGGLSVFGAVHLIAWNFQYPNEIERLIWRISALMVTLLPIIAVLATDLVIPPDWQDESGIKGFVYKASTVILVSVMVLFFVPRLYLLVEAFRSTYFLPPTTYVTTWASNIPHIG